MKHNGKEIAEAFWAKLDYQKEGITVQGNPNGAKVFTEGLLIAELEGKKLTLKGDGNNKNTLKQLLSAILNEIGAKPITGKKVWRHGTKEFVSATHTVTEWRNV